MQLVNENQQLREKLEKLDAAHKKEHDDLKRLKMEKYTLKMVSTLLL